MLSTKLFQLGLKIEKIKCFYSLLFITVKTIAIY